MEHFEYKYLSTVLQSVLYGGTENIRDTCNKINRQYKLGVSEIVYFKKTEINAAFI
jgi:hypothetical protein